MMATIDMPSAEQDDAELVAESLAGNRDAFRKIVERHQTLICSIAYSATGSLSLSEDLAQETFLTAWKQLTGLRERSKLRSWLCGIVRFLIGKELRQQGREPLHGAGPLEGAIETAASEAPPSDQMISKEEGAILWRSLERIPDSYREPLVLFYREHQSIQRVAEALELSEDAVKQRLSRGRKLLQQQVLALVEGALEKTSPGTVFTLGVMSALPLVAATSASAATVTVAATKSGATGKTATGVAALGTILTGGVLLLFSVLGFLVFMGGCFGYLMGRACRQSSRQLDFVTRFWRTIALGFLVLAVPALLTGYWGPGPAQLPQLYHALTIWMALIYPLVVVDLGLWIWHWQQETRRQAQIPPIAKSERKQLVCWLGATMVVPSVMCALFLHAMIFQGTLRSEHLAESEVHKIISKCNDASFSVDQRANGTKVLWIKLPESAKSLEYRSPASPSTLALLAEKGIAVTTRVEGRDYHYLGRPGRWLPLLSFFILPMGVVLMLRRLGDIRGTKRKTRSTEGPERNLATD